MSDDCIVEMCDIKVQFPGVLALKGVNFDLRPGEVHALMGENGAGKSTLMKVLAGVYTNYEGTITYKGEQVVSRSIQEQRERGVSIIFQEMELLPNLTVAENIFLGRQPTGLAGSIDWTAMNRQARKLLDSVNTSISERELVSSLSVGQMQMVEIAKALSFSADVIIMDEPTAALTGKEVDALFDNIRDLRAKGVAICYISHRLEEIKRIADRVTVFRDGANVGTRPTAELTIDEMVTMMVGREMDDYYPKVETTAGEITGLYGLMGAGRTELMRVAFGADRCDSGKSWWRVNRCASATRWTRNAGASHC
ncbi:sugar ABC transporter ATP-binding protein [Arachnia propionica]|uniref:sugar ABC transporter ATP-binding protein n=1 Tax=Arachnia propionica TaxID=1750 RepID=UPI003C6ECE20